MDSSNYVKTGTTIVGFRCKEGIILGADRRSSYGQFPYVRFQDSIKLKQRSKDQEGVPMVVTGTAGYALTAKLQLKKIFQTYLRTYQRQKGLNLSDIESIQDIEDYMISFFNHIYETYKTNVLFGGLQCLNNSASIVAVRNKHTVCIFQMNGHIPQLITQSRGSSVLPPLDKLYKTNVFSTGSGGGYASTILADIDRVRPLCDQTFAEAQESIRNSLIGAMRRDLATGFGMEPQGYFIDVAHITKEYTKVKPLQLKF